jgi:hypothetical protein
MYIADYFLRILLLLELFRALSRDLAILLDPTLSRTIQRFTSDFVDVLYCSSCGRAYSLTAFTHSLTGPVGQPFASHYDGPGLNPQGGNYVKLGFSPLALSRYSGDPDMIDYCGLV